LVCQFAAIGSLTNDGMMQRFGKWIDSHGPKSYRRGLGVLTTVLEQLEWQPTLRNLLMLTCWSQLGVYQVEMTDSAPGIRLVKLLGAARQGKRWSSNSSFVELIQNWDEITEADSMAALVKASTEFAQFAAETADGKRGLVPILDASFFTALGAAHETMITAFLRDPDAYVDPSVYAASRKSYPVPCIGVTYPAGPYAGIDWADATPDDWSPQISFEETLSVASIAELSNAIFLPGEKSLQTTGRYEIRKRLHMEAIRIIR
jgi:hypothetical protein